MAGAATVGKALDLLFHLHTVGAPLGPSEIGRALDLPRSSCHRLLTALHEREVVERDPAGRYRPGLALLSLGLGVQGRDPVVQAARPILEQEAHALGETVFLVGRRRSSLRVLDKCEGSGFLRVAPGIGDVIPQDRTAAGQLYGVLAPAPPRVGEAGSGPDGVVAGPSPPLGFPGADREILTRGYATNRDAWIDGLSVLAVPIWQGLATGPRELAGCLALGASSRRFDEIGEERVAGRLLEAAELASERLGAASASESASRRDRTRAPGTAQRNRETET